MTKYSAKQLSTLAGVSVRTLHHYDEIGLLKPAIRTQAKYRLYGQNELLKLQQILFYKELDFSLQEIMEILEDPGFDLLTALEGHRKALKIKQERISAMLNTLEKTVLNLKVKKMITNEELYEGFTSEETNRMRTQTSELYGKNRLERGENYLKKLSKEEFDELKREQKEIFQQLFKLHTQSPESDAVQMEVARHYVNVRKFWGTHGMKNVQRREYKGLGTLYEADERFTMVDGLAQPAFAKFLSQAMAYFADRIE